MRALWITGLYHPQAGGIPVLVDRVTSALASLCEVGLVTETAHRLPSDERIVHYAVDTLREPATIAEWQSSADRLREIASVFEPDVVHFGSAGEAVYRRDLMPLPAVATVHGNDLTMPWQVTPRGDARAAIVDGLRSCDHVFAVSAHTAALARSLQCGMPLSVVPGGCDLDVFRPLPGTRSHTRARYGLPRDKPIVLTVGRLAPRKGHSTTLAALRRTKLDAHWLIVGRGPIHDELRAEIRRWNFEDRVTLIDHVPKGELALLYNACDVFVMTPTVRIVADAVDSEGFGLVYLEAAACGLPVIGSDAAGCREAIVDECTGLLVRSDDAAALAAAVDRILRDRKLARALGRAGCALVRTSGGWTRVAREILSVYRRLTAHDAGAVPPPDLVAA